MHWRSLDYESNEMLLLHPAFPTYCYVDLLSSKKLMVRVVRFQLTAPPSQAECAEQAALHPDMVKMVDRARIELAAQGSSGPCSTGELYGPKMVEAGRVELPILGCRPRVFPLALRPHGVSCASRTH